MHVILLHFQGYFHAHTTKTNFLEPVIECALPDNSMSDVV
jgi:hypothetical protein